MGLFDKFPYRNTRDLNLNWIIKKIIYLEGIVGAAVSDVAEFLSKKGGKMEGSIDMQNNRIFNVPTPAGDTDVTNRKYVDDKTGNYLPLAGGTMSGAVNMGGNKIANVATPEADADVATKKYVDDHSGGVSGDYLPLAGGTMTGAVNMGGNKITSVADPEAAQDVATKKYVDDHSGGVSGDYLPLAGGTMSGEVNMGGNKIANVKDPEAAQDVATKKYVDDHSGGGVGGDYLPLAGGTMTGEVNMGGNKITNVANPAKGTDAANKTYVESKAAPTSVKIPAGKYNATIINQNTFDVVFPLPFVLSSSSKTTAQISNFAVKVNTLTSYAGAYTYACTSINTTKTSGTNVIRFEITSSGSISEQNVIGADIEVKTTFTVTK